MLSMRYIIIAVVLAILYFVFNMSKKYKLVKRDPTPILKKKKKAEAGVSDESLTPQEKDVE